MANDKNFLIRFLEYGFNNEELSLNELKEDLELTDDKFYYLRGYKARNALDDNPNIELSGSFSSAGRQIN